MNIYIKTHGCSNNYYESEIIGGILDKAGYKLVLSAEESDIIIINICTVKGPETALKTIRNLKKENPEKKIVITGCISKEIIPKIREIDEETPLVNTHNILHIVEVLEEMQHGNILEAFVRTTEEKINCPIKRIKKIIGIVPIASGCVDHCAYCSVKLIKGHIHSYPKEKIIKEVKRDVKEGCKEIWLTSQDNGAYGMENKTHALIGLLEDILKIKGDFKVRLGMLNPHHAMKMIDDLISLFHHEKMFKFIHIPIEAGNNEVLGNMKRRYNVFDYKELVYKLRREIPDITIATDIIVGFPGETELQFHDSLHLVQEIKPEILNIARFHSRPNTKAAKMKQLDSKIIKERSRELNLLYQKISKEENKKWLGKTFEVLIEDKGKEDSWVARNDSYRQVILNGNFNLGEKVKVKIIKTTIYDLRGEVVE